VQGPDYYCPPLIHSFIHNLVQKETGIFANKNMDRPIGTESLKLMQMHSVNLD
jgi:hypothetical protein